MLGGRRKLGGQESPGRRKLGGRRKLRKFGGQRGGGFGEQEDGERKLGGRRKLSKFGGQRGPVFGEQEGRRMGRGSLGAGGSLEVWGAKRTGFGGTGGQEDGERKFGGRRKLRKFGGQR